MTGRPVTVDVFVSVDGWAGSDNLPGYFGYFGPELGRWITDQLDDPHLILMGRRTYELLAGLPAEVVDDNTRRLFAGQLVVFSRTLTSLDSATAELCRGDAVERVRELKSTATRPMRTMGSLSIARQLLTARLVDRLRLLTFPLLAGPAGREPFFAELPCADLELAGHRVLDGRIVLTEWAPTGRDIPRG
jgi:dihydrofolate reductase